MSRGIKIIGLNIAGWAILLLAMFAIESVFIKHLLAIVSAVLIGSTIVNRIREVSKR